ncbi:N-isopropylammelide isopropylaminohydrolase [Gloeocapsa sp. PCC 7428]|uniref:amidohydrolase family protein n=1 Tax=Gloeocapsa sp. PCC 7428 TaxID=1173026 RepID=UPI0002A5DEF6|nr:amidohydrolase family protein [Gloeocapsa sp. PCC 7428]AFZ31161.1 N-isopropylammelide isopropylaminohydrolase [Gloeocapsa sp. PCC 7428]
MNLDYALTNATLADRAGRWCIGVAEGKIATVIEGDFLNAQTVWNLDGKVLTAGLVDAHTHLDKALTAESVGDVFAQNGLASAIQAVRQLKSNFTVADVEQRASQALQLSIAAGTTAIRTNVEADAFVELRAVEGLLNVQRSLTHQIDIQLVAFPQEGWFAVPDTLESGASSYVEQALQRGIKVIGGNVNQGLWSSNPEAQVDALFDLALRYDCDLDLHLDNWDGVEAFTLPYVAQKTIEHNYQGRVAVSHIASLAYVSKSQAQAAIELVKNAEISVTVLPTRIKLTRVAELLEAGVNVVCGTDNLRDPFVRYGDADLLKALLLLAQLTGYMANRDLERLWQTISNNAAKMLRLPYGINVGNSADLVVFDAYSISEAILHQATRLAVFKSGQLVAGTMHNKQRSRGAEELGLRLYNSDLISPRRWT